ncbi:MAG: hypothetical protein U1E25_00375 [Methylocystis sp.]
MAEWIEVAVKCGAILGGVFVVFQYLDSKQTERVKTTLSYVQRFEDEKTQIYDAQRRVSSALQLQIGNISRYAQSEMTEQQSLDLRRDLETQILERANRKTKEGDDNIDVLMELDGFFYSLRVCVENNNCDLKIAVGFFRPYAVRLQQNFKLELAKRAREAPGFGRGLEWMARGEAH